MENIPRNLQQTLSRNISGYHQYCLRENSRPTYVSRNLCAMLGLSESELLSDREDLYTRRIVPADRKKYAEFLEKLRSWEQTLTLEYRLVKKDGSIIYVSDTMTSCRSGGEMIADSVLTDITALKGENENLRFLSETMPCGFIKYTCEKIPRVTYINDRMLSLLVFSQRASSRFDELEMYKQNVYLMIPPEDRRRFSLYLDRVYRHGAPIAGEMTVLRSDGSKAYLFGWVTKSVIERGDEEFQSACMDITQRHHIKKSGKLAAI